MPRKAPQVDGDVELGGASYIPPKYGKDGERKAHASVTMRLAHQSERPQSFFDGLVRLGGALCQVQFRDDDGAALWSGIGRFGKATFDRPGDDDPAVLRVPLIVAGETAEELMPLLHYRLELDDSDDPSAKVHAELLQRTLPVD